MHVAGTAETGSTTTRAAAPGGASAGGPRLGLALLVLASAQLMVVLDATIVNVALPHIQRALGFSGSGLEWVVNAYALTFGGLLLLGGRAGDLLGRRKMFIAGLLLFSAASLVGGFATSQAFLLTARAVQGVGGALVAPAALSLITTTFPEGPPRTRAFGVYAAMSIAGGAIGLIGGGLLTTYVSWRWVLFVNVPIGAAVALAAPRVLAETPRRRGRFDLPGALTGTAGIAALVYGLVTAATSPNGVSHWGDAKVDRLAGRRRGAARRVRGDRDPQPARPAAGAAAARPQPHRRLPELRRRGHLHLRHVLLPHRVHAGRLGILRPEDRPRLPPVHRRPPHREPGPSPSSCPASAPARCCWLAPPPAPAACTGCPGSASTTPTPAGCSARPWSSEPGSPCYSSRCPWSR